MNDKREYLLSIAIEQKMTYQETQELLREFGEPELYSRDRRDSIIIWGLYHEKEMETINKLCRLYNCRELVG